MQVIHPVYTHINISQVEDPSMYVAKSLMIKQRNYLIQHPPTYVTKSNLSKKNCDKKIVYLIIIN